MNNLVSFSPGKWLVQNGFSGNLINLWSCNFRGDNRTVYCLTGFRPPKRSLAMHCLYPYLILTKLISILKSSSLTKEKNEHPVPTFRVWTGTKTNYIHSYPSTSPVKFGQARTWFQPFSGLVRVKLRGDGTKALQVLNSTWRRMLT
jgi:hypothetical protein